MIHICIPAHNEAQTLGILLWKIRKVMAEFGRDYEVVVLNDASTDGTPEVLERYRRSLPLRVLTSETPVGYGPATERLLRDVASRSKYPKRDMAITLQGDFTESPEDLVAMVKAVEGGADLVVGRLAREGRELPRPWRLGRFAARFLLGRGVRGAPVSDPLSGFRAYRVVILRKAFREGQAPVASLGRWSANLELLALAAPHARRIDEAPYTLRLHGRPRPTRLRVMDELRSLLPFRRLGWASAEGIES